MICYLIVPEDFNPNHLTLRVPENRLRTEDDTTKRICASKTIKGALRAVGCRYVNKQCKLLIVNCDDSHIKIPTIDQVPDIEITDEVWIIGMNFIILQKYLIEIAGYSSEVISQPGGSYLRDYIVKFL